MSIISNPVTGPVVGQPLSPAFGQQFAGTPPANTITTPNGALTIAQAVALGVLPLNATLTSVNGVAIGAGVPCPTVAQILAGGNSGFSAFGTNVGANGAINQQAFVDGIASGPAVQATGPSPNNTSSLPQAPITGATLCANLVFSGNYGG
jgi:hypothetical protein